MSSVNEEQRVERGEIWQTELRPDVFQLLQRSQRRFHKSILFLVAFDGSNQITGVTEGLAK